jgi:ankyrin repeat protein
MIRVEAGNRWFSVLVLLTALIPVSVRASDAPLVDAARIGEWPEVRALIAQGADVNVADHDGTRALHWAVRGDEIGVADELLGAGADATVEDIHGITPLYLAAANGNAPMVRRLIGAGADPNQVDRTGETVLMIAAQAGDAAAVRVLLEHGADVNATDSQFQQVPLMWAARDGYSEVVEVLIAHGADVHARTRTGEAPDPRLPCINRTGCGSHGLGIIRGGLPERGSRTPVPGAMTPLMYAAREGRIETVRLLLEAGADPNATDANGIRPLLLAISNNHIELARYLLDNGADVNAVDWYGRTPLWAAVEMRNVDLHYVTFEHMIEAEDRQEIIEFIQVLLDRGAEPNIRIQEVPPLRRWIYLLGGSLAWVDFTGQTPFLLASLSGDVDLMRLLLEYGADPHISTFEGTTPLMAAAGINWVVNQTYTDWDSLFDAVKLCWELGMDVNDVNSMGLTALMGAANRGSDDIIRFLVDKGGRLEAKDNEGRTPLDWAGGIFLATHAPEPKPSSIALIQELSAQSAGEQAVASAGAPE